MLGAVIGDRGAFEAELMKLLAAVWQAGYEAGQCDYDDGEHGQPSVTTPNPFIPIEPA